MNRLRILIITDLFPTEATPWGGSFIRSRVDALDAAGHTVDLLALIPRRPAWLSRLLVRVGRGPQDHAVSDERFGSVEFPIGAVQYVAARFGRNPRRAIKKAAATLAAKVDLTQYDAVIAHGMYLVPAGSVAHEAVGPGKYVVVCHGSDVNLLMRRRAAPYVRTFTDARKVIFVSSALRETARRYGLGADVGVAIPNGIDLELFKPSRRSSGRTRFGWSDDALIVAFVGNLLEIKGADRLPEIARTLVEAKPEVQIAVAGDGPLGASLEGLRRVKCLGRLDRDAVADLMAAADVVLLPSRSEGWPSVILEAFASGTPVVGTDVGGIREALGGYGVVVEVGPEIERRLAEGVLAELASPDDSNELRNRAGGFAWESTVAQELSGVSETC